MHRHINSNYISFLLILEVEHCCVSGMAGITELGNTYSKLLLNPHNYKIFGLEGPQIGGIGSERGKKTDAEGQRDKRRVGEGED